MMKLKGKEIFEENGVKYVRETYEGGPYNNDTTITYPYTDPDAPPAYVEHPEPEPISQDPSDTEILMDAVATLYEEVLALKKGGK